MGSIPAHDKDLFTICVNKANRGVKPRQQLLIRKLDEA